MSTILLVEDNPAERAIFRRVLGGAGHVIHELACGAEVLSRVRELRPHVVVLDVNLPDADGHEVCRAIKADPVGASIPVLMLTVKDRREDVLAGLSAGADDYVAKDEATEVLIARVNRLADYRKLAAVAVLNEQLSGVGRLLAGIVHEIRSPLAVIRGHAELMQITMADNAEVQECVDPILRSTLVLQSRLDHLMAAVRTGPTQAEVVDTVAVVREATELFRKGMDPRLRPVAITLVEPDGPRMALADAGRLIQVILNLLANAHEAILSVPDLKSIAKPGQITVRVESASDDGEGRVRIVVRDDGPGIPQSVLGRLFEPFFTTKETGSGYGLYLAHEIVHDQGGRLEAGNDPDGGARFIIWLPAATAEGEGEGEGGSPADPS